MPLRNRQVATLGSEINNLQKHNIEKSEPLLLHLLLCNRICCDQDKTLEDSVMIMSRVFH